MSTQPLLRNADWRNASPSLAYAQRSMGDGAPIFDLFPVLVAGCPRTSTDSAQYPLEIDYRYDQLDLSLFEQPPMAGIDRWAPLLPPLAPGLSMGEGGTALIETPRLASWAGLGTQLFMKDESGNPTWSHKDRLNLCTVSAAVASGAPGIAVASSGNHGASAAAYAARAGIKCVVVASPAISALMKQFITAYDAILVCVPQEERWPVLRNIVQRTGFHPVSNLTRFHTGHPFGPEGYKTIAYELFLELGRQVPGAVVVPTGYGELIYGLWKGFKELKLLGLTARLPRIIAAELDGGPLHAAMARNLPMAEVVAQPSIALSIAVSVTGYRSVIALRESRGAVLQVGDRDILAARDELARDGQWQELSGVTGLAALRKAQQSGIEIEGPVVNILTSSGLKDAHLEAAPTDNGLDWNRIERSVGS
jgi:threonine synthase